MSCFGRSIEAPKIEKLDPAKIGVKQGPKGHIQVDEYQNTNVEGMYRYVQFYPQGFSITSCTACFESPFSPNIPHKMPQRGVLTAGNA